MSLQDLVITPIYLLLFYGVAWMVKPKVTNARTAPYYFPGLTIKFIGAIALGFIYQYYYNGGDTYNYYFWGSKWIWEAFKDSPLLAFRIISSI